MNDNQNLTEGLKNPLFLKIFQTFRMAIQPKSLIIALLALIIICLVGWVLDITNSVVKTSNGTTELDIYLVEPDRVLYFIKTNEEIGCEHTGVFATVWKFAAVRFNSAVNSLLQLNLQQFSFDVVSYCQAIKWAFKYHPIYCILFGLIKLCIISVAGGAICRIAALQLARGEKAGLFEALQYSGKKFTSFFAAPLIPLGIIIVIGLLISLLGLVGNIPYIGELIMSIFMFLAILAGALLAIISIGAIGGFNLMFPAVAYDGSDCFDAISRSMSYVYARPWRMAFYTAVALIYGAICYIFVRFFAFLILFITHLFLGVGIFVDNSSKEVDKLSALWPESNFGILVGPISFANANFTESVAIVITYIWLLIVVGLVISYIISFYFSANTIIYSLMRQRVDGTNFDDIYTLPDETGQQMQAEQTSEESETQADSSEPVDEENQ